MGRPEAIRQFCREMNVWIDTFTRLLGTSRRNCGNLAGQRSSQRDGPTVSPSALYFPFRTSAGIDSPRSVYLAAPNGRCYYQQSDA
jgi:hypothetical protein